MDRSIVVSTEVPAFLAEFPKDRIVHLKGYGVKKLCSEDYDEAIISDLRNMLGKDGVIAWDGDLFHATSFTRVLDKLLAATPLRAVAFCFANGRDVFERSWAERARCYDNGSVIHLVLVAEGSDPRLECGEAHQDTAIDDQGWLALGRRALQSTGSSKVVAIGGGGVAGMEAAAAIAENTQWVIYKVHRAGDPSDFGALYERAISEEWTHVEIRLPVKSADGPDDPEPKLWATRQP
eukprot:TRINITY_DN47568_c0_g1_i1.p1 TRINITY_DN47568_c0_g1~~TRINITY_DN47568_c0_g1_i1.p1  ORF type:complete len:236 (+),score=30.33 TRINITY_DN47568_c0_g1_i1:65-772(+)